MERRVLLAISLSFLVLFLYQSLLPPPPEPAPNTASSTTTAGAAAPTGPAAAAGVSPAPPATAPAPAVVSVQGDEREREFTVTTADVEAVFTNRGGRLRHWRLKHYRDAAGALVDLVPSDGPVLPFSLSTADAAVTARLNDALYAVDHMAPERIDASATPAVLAFVYEGADGLRARKEFRFEPAGYTVTFTPRVTRAGAVVNAGLLWGPGLGDEIARSAGSGGMFSGNYVYPAEGFVYRDGEVTRYAGAAAATAGQQAGAFRFLGIDDHYFVAALVDPPGAQRVDFAHLPLPDQTNPTAVRQLVSFGASFDTPPESLRIFAGPKQFEALRAVDPEFTKVINFGMFAVLAVPLLGALQWVHGFVGNYGWVIVILTILINLVMWPLRHKSVVSMRRMQELQP
ncbi:MAG: membrane protein insertase YidC, partial [Vicinamibacterales bacterium]